MIISIDANRIYPNQSQIDWGCPGCFYHDEKALRKGEPCCTKVTPITINSQGKCTSRREN